MSSALDTIKEWINPNWGRHRTFPPMDAGLRLNTRIDEATDLLEYSAVRLRPDDAVHDSAGRLLFSSGHCIYDASGGEARLVVDCGAHVCALADTTNALIAAIAGRGIVALKKSNAGFGPPSELCGADTVRRSVTAITSSTDGRLLVAVGSQSFGVADWSSALLTGDRSGLLVEINPGGQSRVIAHGLAWPSGVASLADGSLALALSLDHRVERRRPGSFGRSGTPLAKNLPLFPGRLSVDGEHVWVAAPYVRNRMTELLLDERSLLSEMMSELRASDWFVPRLRAENPLTDTMQMGQLRVDGQVKSWAPARSCGIAFRLDEAGRISESVHARVDSLRHGVTAVVPRAHDVVVTANGYGSLFAVGKDPNSDTEGSRVS